VRGIVEIQRSRMIPVAVSAASSPASLVELHLRPSSQQIETPEQHAAFAEVLEPFVDEAQRVGVPTLAADPCERRINTPPSRSSSPSVLARTRLSSSVAFRVGVAVKELDVRDQPPVIPHDPLVAERAREVDAAGRPLDGAVEILGVHPERGDLAVRDREVSACRELLEERDSRVRRFGRLTRSTGHQSTDESRRYAAASLRRSPSSWYASIAR
jgi:hypothetical protein